MLHLPYSYFIIIGTTNATACPPGTMNPEEGGESIDDCLPCSPGYYCEGWGLYEPTGHCLERYYCPSYAAISVPKPSEYLCPPGFFCGNKTSDPYACPPGEYKANT